MQNGVIEEIKGNKFPIGGGIFKNQTNFTNTKLKLAKGDSIYFSSDGFPDQFGGPKGKKFMYKQLKTLLQEIAAMPEEVQLQALGIAMDNWKGKQEQVDDVTLIGVRIP